VGSLEAEKGINVYKTLSPLADSEGYCVDAQVSCPTNTIDMNILSSSTCNNDEAALKASCPSCVLDGYSWYTNPYAIRHGDNYDGQCVADSSSLINGLNDILIVDHSSCPLAQKLQTVSDHHLPPHAAFIGIGIFLVCTLCFCCMLARCISKRRAAKLAALNRLNTTNQSAVAEAPLYNSLHPAYPAQQQQPQQSALVASHPLSVNSSSQSAYAEPLLSAPSAVIGSSVVRLPSAYPLAYPVLNQQPVPSAPPAYAYHRI